MFYLLFDMQMSNYRALKESIDDLVLLKNLWDAIEPLGGPSGSPVQLQKLRVCADFKLLGARPYRVLRARGKLVGGGAVIRRRQRRLSMADRRQSGGSEAALRLRPATATALARSRDRRVRMEAPCPA